MPPAHGVHAEMGSIVCLMKFEDAPDLAYLEGLHSGTGMDADCTEETQLCSDAYGSARAAALHPEASLRPLETVMEEYGSHVRTLQSQQHSLAEVELQRDRPLRCGQRRRARAVLAAMWVARVVSSVARTSAMTRSV
ncbi:hypothetical protein [Streptomyces bohaiensis]|uniref:hypothetical protein n=1 Tax=Streptomyces bohaiensis TaxID=1431344 RepID=UPI003B784FFF